MGLVQEIRSLVERPRIMSATKTANWNSGVATSGAAGADLVTVGAANQWYRLNQFAIISSGFNALATVTVRAYMNVAGVNHLILTDSWVMPEEVIFLSWWFDTEFFGPMRVEILSNQAADDGLAVTYEYRIKSW